MTELSFTLPEKGEPRANSDARVKDALSKTKEVVNGQLTTGNLSASAAITSAQLSSGAKPVGWYTPKIIATEESRTNTAFGTLTTADEIKGVVLPEGGQIIIGYQALWKESVAGTARAAIFLGANQLKAPRLQNTPGVSEAGTGATSTTGKYGVLGSMTLGLGGSNLQAAGEDMGLVTTGMPITGAGIPCYALSGGAVLTEAGSVTWCKCAITAAAGTYDISVRFKSSSGTVTAKERKLWVETLGV
jgi:hypothetical protein